MGFHTYPVERADALEDVERYRYCSREELVGHLALSGDEVVLDLGSGTGFYTDEVAPHGGHVYAVDVQAEMHGLYREKGLPGNVTPVTAGADALPLVDGAVDAAYSTMTYHEFASDRAMAELRRVLAPGARAVHVDWTRRGSGEEGPPLDERYDLERARSRQESAGFAVEHAIERPETFCLVALNEY